MRKTRLYLGAMLALALLPAASSAWSPADTSQSAASPWPVQVWARVSYEPTAFPAGQYNYLEYELYLTNFSSDSIALKAVDVVDSRAASAPPLAHFAERSLGAVARTLGSQGTDTPDDKPYAIPAGATVVLFVEVKIPRDRPVPKTLLHRLQLQDAAITGAPTGTHTDGVKTLSRPVRGTDWTAADGPGDGPDNHHRRGIFIRDGQLTNSRRLAIDWKIVRNGKSFQGDEHADSSYFAYGQPVLAVADGTVVISHDGLPDNPPGHGVNFHPAVPISMDNVGGNHIVLDIGNGQFAHYFHLHAGSLRVKTGDRVHRGDVIAAIGASGDAREPHVHFELTNTAPIMMGEGIPYVIDHYRVVTSDDVPPGERKGELPLDDNLIDFGK